MNSMAPFCNLLIERPSYDNALLSVVTSYGEWKSVLEKQDEPSLKFVS